MTRRSALRAVLSPRTVLGTAVNALLIGTLCLRWLTRMYWGRSFMFKYDEWVKFTEFASIAVSVAGAAWLCSLGLALWHRPPGPVWWRVAVQALLIGALVSFLAGALLPILRVMSRLSDPTDLPVLLVIVPNVAVMLATMSGLLLVVGFLTNRSAAWVRRCSGATGGDDHGGERAVQGE
ncbi:hypothetical protein [Deinococcus sp. PEB2-63]